VLIRLWSDASRLFELPSLARPYHGIKRAHRARDPRQHLADDASIAMDEGARGAHPQELVPLDLRAYCVLLAEFIDTAAGIYNFLLARIEGMAVGTHFDL
jgi:hypothetical protein